MLADAMNGPEWATWLGVPVWVGGLGFLLWLWLTKRIMLVSDHEVAMSAERERSDEQVESAELRVTDLQNRVDHLIVDRDAWREAHDAEVMARIAAEKAAAKLLEASDLSVRLLDALTETIRQRHGGVA